jgi:hypothetical protein
MATREFSASPFKIEAMRAQKETRNDLIVATMEDMGFVVRAESAAGLEMWVSASRFAQSTFGPRENAEVFRTQSDAHAAIGKIPLTFEHAGFVFMIEAADRTK